MMRLAKLLKLKTLEQELQSLPKLYNSHIWITPPGTDGLSFLGISQYAKHYFVRLNKLDFETFPRTNFGIANKEKINVFIEETKERKEKGQLCLAEQIQWQRFEYKQGQPFALLQTTEFDVELQAPLDMRVIQIEFECQISRTLLMAPYYFKVQPLDLSQLALLSSEDKYNKSIKMIF